MKIKKWDFFLLFGILLLAILFFGWYQPKTGDNDAQVVITRGSEIYAIYPLAQDREIEINHGSGKNKLIIRNFKVFMESANCPDQICVRHAPISLGQEIIVCLPNQLAIEIKKADGEVDTFAK